MALGGLQITTQHVIMHIQQKLDLELWPDPWQHAKQVMDAGVNDVTPARAMQ